MTSKFLVKKNVSKLKCLVQMSFCGENFLIGIHSWTVKKFVFKCYQNFWLCIHNFFFPVLHFILAICLCTVSKWLFLKRKCKTFQMTCVTIFQSFPLYFLFCNLNFIGPPVWKRWISLMIVCASFTDLVLCFPNSLSV